ncbi:hypothetical protein GDO78_018712 [Eleutherodactylus coqui]|uniref:Uncharacterized protein n=1 Tax=Eleutherodactylus coqui TaxID=57060 RepID=A0A8J6EJL1_ELECQ|nr:hypothetical protein GDO78_018712 [Eleutherodactylus coqui]
MAVSEEGADRTYCSTRKHFIFYYKRGSGFPVSPKNSREEVDTTIQSVHLFGAETTFISCGGVFALPILFLLALLQQVFAGRWPVYKSVPCQNNVCNWI